ncbi:unnamed protein product [Owenia fusiformis]|uniref:Uncharacterized protein n=1 Tax=Owenia fusiformis TaxID=6347 RepID=A0A8J1UVI1_OWEFU|nr:unnamed protein product [Owenia fusiformis]
MPLGSIFGKKKQAHAPLVDNPPPNMSAPPSTPATDSQRTNGAAGGQTQGPGKEVTAPRHTLKFHCQQAHGSPTGIISGFTNVRELYQKIAQCYDISPSEILFCTLNTHKIDMTRLLGGQIGLEDFIFAHIRGQPKELDVTKSEDALGLTITDNGAGYAFIKRIKEGSIMDKTPFIAVGDHIEKINEKSLIGCRHFEVAKMLKEIPKGSTFTIRTVAPMQSGFSNIGPNTGNKKSGSVGTGKQTLRLRSTGPATVQEDDGVVGVATDKINNLLESFMGINDEELAQTIWELGENLNNPHNFAEAIDESDLGAFGFTDDFKFDLWGAISDAKSGRLVKAQEFNEQF